MISKDQVSSSVLVPLTVVQGDRPMRQLKCNICGYGEFERGPGGRMSANDKPPRCSECWSLERHRSLRAGLIRVPTDILSWRRAIQFAPDRSLDSRWFRSYEESRYEGENSIDLQAIDRPDASYDFISLSSVLEFVPDDQKAFNEIRRVASSKSIIHCTFMPEPSGVSRHFNQPQGGFNRYHYYGEDIEERFGVALRGMSPLIVDAIDPVTEIHENIHFFCADPDDTKVLAASFKRSSEAINSPTLDA